MTEHSFLYPCPYSREGLNCSVLSISKKELFMWKDVARYLARVVLGMSNDHATAVNEILEQAQRSVEQEKKETPK